MEKAQFKPRELKTSRGAQIFVGRNAKENTFLSCTFANPDDIFLHVSDFPGSHVILRGDNLSIEDIKEAAMIAAHFSKAKKKIVKVDYTEARFLRRPKGAPTGLVELEKFKFIKIEKNLEILNRLLENKKGE